MSDKKERPTRFSDWFDVHNPEHMAAFKVYIKSCQWPKGFVPAEFVKVCHLENTHIVAKMAEAWWTRAETHEQPNEGLTATVDITGATVLLTYGTDEVRLHTNKPSPFPPSVSSENLSLRFEAASGSGVDYCRRHFRILPRVIDTRAKSKAH